MKNIGILGAGSWGTTLAILATENGYNAMLWTREKEIIGSINDKNENKQYLPGIKIHGNVKANNSVEEVASNADLIVNAIPVQFTRSMAKKYSKHIGCNHVVNVAKGIELGTYKRMSEVLKEELPKNISVATLSGPNHAEEVSRKMPTATVIASEDAKSLSEIKKIFHTDYFRVFLHDDMLGVEVCGALKNIAAIATGVCDGLGYGDNARASIITLGLMEMSTYGRFLGAKRSTFYGLAGVGDLVATCTSKHSRNRLVGEKIAKGTIIESLKKEMKGMVAEGIQTTKAVYEFSKKNKLQMPLTKQAYEVMFENKDLKKAISDLLKIE
ncbi:MAG: NAD(P)H-dependent glycerol-3-phosphate dehydrogenase [Candidatus Woesearchaeota archaeon]|jgi:glycerol-3-phosphate dehydrogenase (NAD(P)+)|nr:NAD(P)H-dependent glycerol-3-phosphate dehydrogenase [Candidatus Woesearchaeota archaeon]MDP7623068.1 NAD(P)H-dependent glycerol-3-phosphate dehydrogenase [Candidatus Woesearchaeota archaeon]HJN56339.1 NAD(P)H-dependent glycerol-3-phosphate dehydrogenase [Candidatus Woesearchaeota archaeon]|tara:strand:+ start:21164 stop:22144 length:981 start_codon:yes stop_codon:yes gene_type:complete